MYDLSYNKPVVQKYGGTSVGSVERIGAIAERIKDQVNGGFNKIAVVVSAMSGETNRLVDLVRQINPQASAKNYDMAVSAGEQVSAALMAAALERVGIKSRGFLAYQLGLKTDSLHSKARIHSIDTAKISDAWEEGLIPVIAGFQGVTDEMEITTLGRGGSDTSAVALAVALGAGFCEINTDVDGVFTADPRYVEGAHLAELMDFEVALEMASLGSKVLHCRCVELGAKYNMPIVVRNTFTKNDHRRTKIMSFSEEQKLEAPVVSGITLDRNIARVAVSGFGYGSGIISGMFERIAKLGINVDIIVHNRSNDDSPMRIGFTIAKIDTDQSVDCLKSWAKEMELNDLAIEVEDKLAKVSAVGLGMQSHSGVASRTFSVLAEAGIEIHMISTSEIKISMVVEESYADKAAQILHDTFVVPKSN